MPLLVGLADAPALRRGGSTAGATLLLGGDAMDGTAAGSGSGMEAALGLLTLPRKSGEGEAAMGAAPAPAPAPALAPALATAAASAMPSGVALVAPVLAASSSVVKREKRMGPPEAVIPT